MAVLFFLLKGLDQYSNYRIFQASDMWKLFVISLLLLCPPISAQIEPEDFLSNFESGNVANITQVGADSFRFSIMLDDNQGDTYGWYFFAIAGNAGRTATLFLANPDSWQNETCKPLYSNDRRTWSRVASAWRAGQAVAFSQVLAADTVWFAQGIPFTVAEMEAFLDTLATGPHVTRQTLGYSVNFRPINQVTVSDTSRPDSLKKTVWLISRQHPMESPATFLLRGLLERVTSLSPFSRMWLRDIDLRVVPAVNVDGVAEGYSRHNVNGVNLNRDWHIEPALEEPEVRAVHGAIENHLSSGGQIDFFMDLHAAPDNYDFGFRMSWAYTGQDYFANQETFLHLLETFDHWQNRSRWRDLDTNYAFGVSCVVLYDMHGIDVFSSELPWTRRADGSFIDEATLTAQGAAWAEAIYYYLWPLSVANSEGRLIEEILPGQSFIPKVWDFDQRGRTSLSVSAYCPETDDSETVVIQRQDNDGRFAPSSPVATDTLPAVPGDGRLSIRRGGTLTVAYADPLISSRVTRRLLEVGPTCDYAEGDVNGSGEASGTDVVYLVNYLKGSQAPPGTCDCGGHGGFFAAADVNGSCDINGLDVIYLVNYFKGGAPLGHCADCPPDRW